MRAQVIEREAEKRLAAKLQDDLQGVRGRLVEGDIGRDSATAEDFAPRVCAPHIRVRGRPALLIMQVIVVWGDAGVLPLNQPPGGRVVMGRSQSEASMLAQGIDGLYESFAEARLAHHQSTVVILESPGDDFCRARGPTVNEDDHRVLMALLARGRDVTLLARISPRVIDDQLVFLEEVVGD